MSTINTTTRIRTGQSKAEDARAAVREFHDAVWQPGAGLVVFFCSSEYDLDAVADEMRRLFADTRVMGCTTAGEIGPAGYCDHSLSGVSFPGDAFVVATGLLARLQEFHVRASRSLVQDLLRRLEEAGRPADAETTFAMLLVDGLSLREEPVTRSLQHALGNIQLFGGSAGDGVRSKATHVFHDGSFHSDGAVLVLVSTDLPFFVFKTQHFVALDARLVVTDADPTTRVVREINGLPAATEYARCVGVRPDQLDPLRFAARPVVVVIDGTDYVRSIQRVNPDGSLGFYCAIDEGIVLRVASGVDLVENLEAALARVRAAVGTPELVIGFDCILRNVEITQSGLKEQVADLLKRHNTVGFSTYGEQFGGVHVNQTLTGIAIGHLPSTESG
jgi:hypothetical protein